MTPLMSSHPVENANRYVHHIIILVKLLLFSTRDYIKKPEEVYFIRYRFGEWTLKKVKSVFLKSRYKG